MSYRNLFNITDAHIIGKSHQHLMYNNQDAFSWKNNDSIIVGVVCDGCGSRPNSEVGAKLGATFISNYLLEHYASPNFKIEQLQAALEMFMLTIAKQLGHNSKSAWKEVLQDYFLFTIIGFIVDHLGTTFFYIGDGAILFNDVWMDLSTNNKPDYLSYNLLESNQNLQFKTFYQDNPIRNLLIATDGVQDILEKASAKAAFENSLRGKDIFKSPIAFNQLLTTNFLELIYDDTTIIFLQKKS
jgi:hypothetical protein